MNINCRNYLIHPRNQDNVTLIEKSSIQNKKINQQDTFPSIVHEREELITHEGKNVQICYPQR
jgi:hypothetical protein